MSSRRTRGAFRLEPRVKVALQASKPVARKPSNKTLHETDEALPVRHPRDVSGKRVKISLWRYWNGTFPVAWRCEIERISSSR